MKLRTGPTAARPSLEAVAAEWLFRHESGRIGSRDHDLFENWLAADPRHREAFESVQHACDVAARHAGAAEIMQMRGAALAATGPRQALWKWAAAAAVTCFALGGLWMLLRPINPVLPHTIAADDKALNQHSDEIAGPGNNPDRAVYRTQTGERATVSLPDGSVVTLDTQTSLRVSYSASERGIQLLTGQALFAVAKQASRPFNVYAGDRLITALGTLFNVRLDGAKLRVALLEGKVRVARRSESLAHQAGAGDEVVMAPGDELESGQAVPVVVKAADTARISSWRFGTVVFEDTRLADAVAEMNRYSIHPISIGDRKLEGYRLSGVFKTGDPDRFAGSIAEVFPTRIQRNADGAIRLSSPTQ